MRALILATLALFPMAAFAAGSNDETPPTPTATTLVCEKGMVWDVKTKKCVAPQSGQLDDDTRYRAVRELAYDGQYKEAMAVLATMSDQNESRVLTYYGFTNRKSGNVELGMQYYDAALKVDPDNILARSYMGQGLVAQGEYDLARVQLMEIQNRGGRSTWAEKSLMTAIETGVTYSF
jgi:tetratricopeptide (TPR) repeat protein